jgi:hypothetical protein
VINVINVVNVLMWLTVERVKVETRRAASLQGERVNALRAARNGVSPSLTSLTSLTSLFTFQLLGCKDTGAAAAHNVSKAVYYDAPVAGFRNWRQARNGAGRGEACLAPASPPGEGALF